MLDDTQLKPILGTSKQKGVAMADNSSAATRASAVDPDAQAIEEILARLRRVEGQIRGIQRMVIEGRACEAVATQLLAARAALDQASVFIMIHHIRQCLANPSAQVEQAQLNRVVSFFVRFAESSTANDTVEDA